MRTAVILQSNYIPWRGYFDLMARADVFVLYDEVQYTKNDWRNRNQIITKNGPHWLTIPVKKSGKFGQSIAQTEVIDGKWAAKHWMTITQNYTKAPFFAEVSDWLHPCYTAAADQTHISKVNQIFLRAIAGYLGFETQIVDSADIPGTADRVGRLVQICTQLEADRYLSGPAAKSYLDESAFADQGIGVDWMEYPPYRASPSNAEHAPASILDALFWLPKGEVFER